MKSRFDSLKLQVLWFSGSRILYVHLRSKIESRKLSSSLICMFFDGTNFCESNEHFFHKLESSLEV